MLWPRRETAGLADTRIEAAECNPKTSWLPTNSTLIDELSFCAGADARMRLLGVCTENGRILLVILFPRDTAAVTALDSNDVWAFNEGMSRHDIWHLGVDQQYPGVR